MKSAPVFENEAERLEALLAYQILDTEFEAEYDQLVELAASICGTPISLVSLIDKDRQWFKASHGLEARETARETARDIAFCDHTIHGEQAFIVENALNDPRFSDNPLVVDGPEIRFYAGVPLKNRAGYALGTLCVIDQSAKTLSTEQIRALEILANQTVQLMELRLANLQQKKALVDLERQHTTLNKMHQFNLRMLRLVGDEFEDPMSELSALLKQISAQDNVNESIKQASQEHFLQLAEVHQSLDYLVHWQKLQSKVPTPATASMSLMTYLQQAIKRQGKLASKVDKYFDLKSTQIESEILADAAGLNFSLNEILHNSLKFSSGEAIELELFESDQTVSLAVRDTGPGFGPDQLQSLQNNLSPMPTAGAQDQKGLGLGLMIAKRYLSHWQAEIETQNHLAGGAEVKLTFLKATI